MTKREKGIILAIKGGAVLNTPQRWWARKWEITGLPVFIDINRWVLEGTVQTMKKKELLEWVDTPRGRFLVPTANALEQL